MIPSPTNHEVHEAVKETLEFVGMQYKDLIIELSSDGKVLTVTWDITDSQGNYKMHGKFVWESRLHAHLAVAWAIGEALQEAVERAQNASTHHSQ